ncbi:hypothetical protein [Atlantibacter subterraneus]|uniref:hypothetical protein n=1 Tax=Atlantibacter subterraneus TaxID=255519 RepID=UPI0028B1BEF7|nr:hypothetical protein [Atlantibacter subterranea]
MVASNGADYEKYQLSLIAAEYESKGFEIYTEYLFAGSQLAFDAIAFNRLTGDGIIIELINAGPIGSRKEHLLQRAEAIRNIVSKRQRVVVPEFAGIMRWSVDFRYIDAQGAPERRLSEEIQSSFSKKQIHYLLARRLPASIRNYRVQRLLNTQFLSDWSLIAQLIRAFISHVEQRNTVSAQRTVLEHYNILLARFRFSPAEDNQQTEIPDLFMLHNFVMEIINGGQVPPSEVKALRVHLIHIRSEMRKWFKNKDVFLSQ